MVGDSRFDEVKHNPAKFTAFWMAQGTSTIFVIESLLWCLHTATWILVVGLPVYLVSTVCKKSLWIISQSLVVEYKSNILPAGLHPPLGIRDYASIGLFAGSLLFEVIADRQKSVWREAKDTNQHNEKFIKSGLWSISRHPK